MHVSQATKPLGRSIFLVAVCIWGKEICGEEATCVEGENGWVEALNTEKAVSNVPLEIG